MTAADLLPSKVYSNVYDCREMISDKLNELLKFRLNLEFIKHAPSDVLLCEDLLKSEHQRFISVCSIIDLSEKVSFSFGGLETFKSSFISI